MGLKNYFFDFQRTPAPSSGLPMNSIPAVSKADLMALRVFTWLEGTPSSDSRRISVEKPISAFSANCLAVHPVRLRAALI